MSLYVETKLNTELGEIALAITQGNHISVTGAPVVRDVKFDAHLHFYLDDGVWGVRRNETLSIRRSWVAGKGNRFHELAPKTSLEKVVSVYTKAVQAYAEANPDLFVAAQSKMINREIERAQAAVNDLQAQLDAAKEKLRVLVQSSGGAPVLSERQKEVLDQMHERFISVRLDGYMHRRTLKWHEPVTREIAENEWKSGFEAAVIEQLTDPEVIKKLGLDADPSPSVFNY